MTRSGSSRQRWRLRVEGVVQGVGFRPFVARLAEIHRLDGLVGNDTAGVFIEAEGDPPSLEAFVMTVEQHPPPLARVDRVSVETGLALGTATGFAIVASSSGGRPETGVPADAATCADCLHELTDPADRRFGYPFINCTNCGPRYTIVSGIPYDRANTTMAPFTMCAQCQAEYDDPLDRRFHAQPVCCPECGPTLTFCSGTEVETGDPVRAAARLLRAGGILAVKGLGGYHLAASARDETAVARLRGRKHREERPFALMVTDVNAARELGLVDAVEADLLRHPAAPIVLLRQRRPGVVAAAVAPGRHELGVMLAYTPLHHLLLDAFGDGPLVMTSGNLSDEPIAYDDADARARLGGLADGFLTHDRAIHTRVDDSVVRVSAGRVGVVRRSRGYVPGAVRMPWQLRRDVLGCGAELKNTFCLGHSADAVVSHHIGDLENYETFTSFVAGIEHLSHLLDVRPEVVAHDLHPDYLSTKHAQELTDVALVSVQHHHAHIASCLADNGLEGPAIGVALDGLGFGTDGTLWGGEFLVADLAGFTRVAHLVPVLMPGGAAAIREPWRMALAYLDRAFDTDPPEQIVGRLPPSWPQVLAAARAGTNAPQTSSMGRLFDAAAALLGVRQEITYEGQAAIELEQLAEPSERGWYAVPVTDGEPARIDGAALIRAVVEDRSRGTDVGLVAARFHNSVGRAVVDVCETLRNHHGLGTVALSGGVFQNVRLLEQCTAGLIDRGFTVAQHRQVPTNDGGISLGQVAVAGARDRAGLVTS